MTSLDTPFFKAVLDTMYKGLRTHSYTLRGQVLCDIYGMTPSTLMKNMFFVDSCTNISWLAKKIFSVWPSFIEKSECITCHGEKQTQLETISVEDTNLKKFIPGDFIEKSCFLPDSICMECRNHDGGQHDTSETYTVKHRLVHLGKYLVLICLICQNNPSFCYNLK